VTWRARPKERLWASVAFGRVGPIPDEDLWCDIEITRPGDGPVSGSDSAKEGVVGPQPIEHRAPQQILGVPLHNGTVGQRETESSSLEGCGRSDPK
jgi:hypothetical protein